MHEKERSGRNPDKNSYKDEMGWKERAVMSTVKREEVREERPELFSFAFSAHDKRR